MIPSLPEPLEPLRELAYNLRWAWDHDSIELFRRLDTDLWESTGHNPVLMLGSIDQMRLVSAAADDSFLAHLERVSRALESRMGQNSWFQRVHSPAGKLLVAYFSAEFGLTECVSIFAGGLGVLAGDHVKFGQRPGSAAGGCGPALSAGLFPPVSEPGRMAAGRIRNQRFPQSSAATAGPAGWQTVDHRGAVSRPRGYGAHLVGAGRPGSGLSVGYQCRGQQPGGPRDHR